jgi:hypothetical protein
MPPNLHHGVVRGHRKQAVAQVQKFCKCHECIQSMTIDRGTGAFVKGNYLGMTQWKAHRARTLQSSVASIRLAQDTPDDLTAPKISYPSVPDLFSLFPPPGISNSVKAPQNDAQMPVAPTDSVPTASSKRPRKIKSGFMHRQIDPSYQKL